MKEVSQLSDSNAEYFTTSVQDEEACLCRRSEPCCEIQSYCQQSWYFDLLSQSCVTLSVGYKIGVEGRNVFNYNHFPSPTSAAVHYYPHGETKVQRG